MSETEGARAAGVGRARLNYFNYFTEIEEAFVRRRGRHLLVSTLDWALMESWKQMGVPLHVVLRGIETAFDSYESRPRKRSVKSLYYCQEEVEAQFAEWVESQTGAAAPAGGGGGQPSDEAGRGLPFPREVIAAHLADARAALARGAEGEGGDLSEAMARAAARLEELERDFARAARPDAAQLEDALTDLEHLLDRALRAATPESELAAARGRAEQQLRPYRERMGRETYEQTLDNLLAKLLREGRGVPRLSLFYL
ncbi:MAG TPA: hypothetical protein VG148_12475 [Pyrinomonadaceae bacterium]|nr:hypothetical protein [Pyrinomonadaceae bacterium]